MGRGLRQVRRLLAAYRREGGAALAHGNRGRRPVHTLSEEIRRQVVELARGCYEGFNHHHLTELLAEREGLELSRSSVWRILTAAGLKSSRHRRPAKHRCRRERYPQQGMLLQIDGGQRDCLEGRGPYHRCGDTPVNRRISVWRSRRSTLCRSWQMRRSLCYVCALLSQAILLRMHWHCCTLRQHSHPHGTRPAHP